MKKGWRVAGLDRIVFKYLEAMMATLVLPERIYSTTNEALWPTLMEAHHRATVEWATETKTALADIESRPSNGASFFKDRRALAR